MIKRNVMFFCLLAVFFASQTMAADANTGSADENVAKTSGLTAEQIVERNIAARGGAAAWHKIQSISMTGKLDAGHERIDGGEIIAATSPKSRADKKAELRKVAMNTGEEAADKIIRLPFQMDLKRPLKSRIEVPFNGQTAVQVYDGTQGWKLRPYLGRHEVEPFNPQEAKIASEQQELDGPLLDHVAKGIKVSLAGTEQVNGHKAYKMELALKNGDVRNLWIDAQTFLDLKIDGVPRKLDGKPRQIATYFHDYRTVNGVKIPYELETIVEGFRGSEKINIEHVVINPKLEDSRFVKTI